MKETEKAIEQEAEQQFPILDKEWLKENFPYSDHDKHIETVTIMRQAYAFGRSKADEEKEKEIEFLNQNCDNLNEVINDCGKEIGRLKELMEVAFRYGFTNNFKKSTVDFQWQQFKTENNL